MEKSFTIVGLGEILWDVFPTGPRFGGAPANFACTAAEIAGERYEVAIVGAVGQDALGEQSLGSLQQHRVSTAYVERNPYVTGQVFVKLDEHGHASYEFASNTAWDHLTWNDELSKLARRTSAVCFGTLGQRSMESKDTIQRLVHSTTQDCLRILDINLRPPYWSKLVIEESLALANVVKLSDAELPIVAELLQLAGSTSELLRQLMDRYQLRLVALTRGSDGSLLIEADGALSDWSGTAVSVVDTVGAGDAFTACLAIGMLEKRSLESINRWASQVAAYVCSQPGATPSIPAELHLAAQTFAD